MKKSVPRQQITCSTTTNISGKQNIHYTKLYKLYWGCLSVAVTAVYSGMFHQILTVYFSGLMTLYYMNIYLRVIELADPRGAPGTRAPPPPPGSKFFHFHAVFGKNVKNNSNFGSWRPPPGKILDPPLNSYVIQVAKM